MPCHLARGLGPGSLCRPWKGGRGIRKDKKKQYVPFGETITRDFASFDLPRGGYGSLFESGSDGIRLKLRNCGGFVECKEFCHIVLWR
jgi:hypothetical protein